ncbi:conjugal transfer protein [Veillonellaceae bacterium M1-70]|nr:conjugal transfer protein [Veillonellaceae bacterium M1-70]
MIRIRSPTKEKVNSISISDWKRKTPIAFFIEKKRRNF